VAAPRWYLAVLHTGRGARLATGEIGAYRRDVRRSLATLLACLLVVALALPSGAAADHITTSATVTARLKERRSTDFWTVEIRWTAACTGQDPGTAWYGGDLTMIDADTGERIYVGGVVDTSGSAAVSGTSEWVVSSIERERHLIPELTIQCYQNSPLHGGTEVVVTGASVFIPPRFSGGGSGSGGAGGDYGSGDPTRPLGGGGCANALVGTERPDVLTAGGGGDVVFGLGAGDRLDGGSGHDCLIGGSGDDVLRGKAGSDRITGGRGRDRLVGGPAVNAYDAGPGPDGVDARNGKRERIRCGSGFDRAQVDRNDRVRGCERVILPS
jgi:Ca2+-binding RTX toxin-like protein